MIYIRPRENDIGDLAEHFKGVFVEVFGLPPIPIYRPAVPIREDGRDRSADIVTGQPTSDPIGRV